MRVIRDTITITVSPRLPAPAPRIRLPYAYPGTSCMRQVFGEAAPEGDQPTACLRHLDLEPRMGSGGDQA